DLLNSISTTGTADKKLANRYRQKSIKIAVIDETHGKCLYCESKMLATSPGEIEHIIPKSIYPELTFVWTNLSLSCGDCNRKKSAHTGNLDPLLNPYVDNPSKHLAAAGSWVLPRRQSRKGRKTEAVIQLNRPHLLEVRQRRLELLKSLISSWHNEE